MRRSTPSGVDGEVLLGRERANPLVYQVRLYRRSAGRIDQQSHCLGIAHAERAVERTGNAGQRQSGPQRGRKADHPGETDHGNHGDIAAPPLRHQPAAGRDGTGAHLIEKIGHRHLGLSI